MEVVKLNVGGTLFITTKSTLTSTPGTYFDGMLNPKFKHTNLEDGSYFLDLSPDIFKYVLEILRNPGINVSKFNLDNEKKEILKSQLNFLNIENNLDLEEFDDKPKESSVLKSIVDLCDRMYDVYESDPYGLEFSKENNHKIGKIKNDFIKLYYKIKDNPYLVSLMKNILKHGDESMNAEEYIRDIFMAYCKEEGL